MKKTLICCLFLCCGLMLKAQYGGEFTLGVRLNYIGGGVVMTDKGLKNKGYTLKTTVSPGYFVCNNLAFGTGIGYEYMKDDIGHQYTIDCVPFVRYYVPGNEFRFFVHLESGYGWGKSFLKDGHDGWHSLWKTALKPGLFIRIKEYLATEVTLSSLEYKYINMKSSKRAAKSNYLSQWRFNWLDISFGVSAIFNF